MNNNGNNYFLYRAFGLIIASCYECHGLIPVPDNDPDIFICHGKVPERLSGASFSNNWIEGKYNQLLIFTPAGKFFIEDGKSITVSPAAKASMHDIRLFLFGSAMGAVLYQRRLFALHGSAVAMNNRAFIFSGPSGIGKSTLAAAMICEGFNLLADDVSAIFFDDDTAKVNPGIPQLKLHHDVVRYLGDLPATSNPACDGKSTFPLPDSFSMFPVELNSVYILARHKANSFEDKKLTGIDKFVALRKNTYRPLFIKAMELQKFHFEILQRLAGKIEVHLILRPEDGLCVEKLADFIMQIILR